MNMKSKSHSTKDHPSDAFNLDTWPFYHLARINAYYIQRVNPLLKPLGIDLVRWRVLSILSDSGTCTISRLAEETVSQISTMGKVVQRMTAEGFVTSQPSSADARVTEVNISEKGKDILDIIQENVIGPIGSRALRNVSKEEITTLNRVCDKFFENLTF